MLQKSYLLLIATFFISLSSCEKLKDLTTFSINNTSSITIPASPLVTSSPISITTPGVESNTEQAFSNNNTKANLVEEAILESLTLEITSPSDQKFDFLNEIEIYIKAEGLNEVLLASRMDIPESIGSSLELETTGENLKEYIKKENFSIKTKVLTDKVLNNDVDIDVKMEFKIRAKVL